MKKTNTVVALATFLALAVSSACTGVQARENVLMPAMSRAYTTVIEKHVDRGIAEAELDATAAQSLQDLQAGLIAALDSGDRHEVDGSAWATLRPFALAGIDARVQAGEIGPGVADSIRETVTQFDQRMVQLLLR